MSSDPPFSQEYQADLQWHFDRSIWKFPGIDEETSRIHGTIVYLPPTPSVYKALLNPYKPFTNRGGYVRGIRLISHKRIRWMDLSSISHWSHLKSSPTVWKAWMLPQRDGAVYLAMGDDKFFLADEAEFD